MTVFRDPDMIKGSALTIAGSGGFTVQALTDGLSLLVVILNGILALAGIYYLVRKHRVLTRRDEDRTRKSDRKG